MTSRVESDVSGPLCVLISSSLFTGRVIMLMHPHNQHHVSNSQMVASDPHSVLTVAQPAKTV